GPEVQIQGSVEVIREGDVNVNLLVGEVNAARDTEGPGRESAAGITAQKRLHARDEHRLHQPIQGRYAAREIGLHRVVQSGQIVAAAVARPEVKKVTDVGSRRMVEEAVEREWVAAAVFQAGQGLVQE